MIDFDYAVRHLAGVWAMVRGLDNWRDDIDRSMDGVFKSFWALPMALGPALFILAATARGAAGNPEFSQSVVAHAPPALLLIAGAVALVAYWLASIALIVAFLQRLQATRQVSDTIIAFNWVQLLTLCVEAIPAGLFAITRGPEVFVTLSLVAAIFTLYATWRVLRLAAGVNVSAAIGIIVTLIIVEFVINITSMTVVDMLLPKSVGVGVIGS
ncbi:MAG: hypothetical protein AAGC77_00570 [Pseudomonadota bacterium]